jgi:RES domain-containing protein
MTPLPVPLGGGELVAWRLDQARHAATWDSGEGSYLFGGRWSGVGTRAVYCAVDPATAILEVAVHKGFEALDTVAFMLTEIEITEPAAVHVVKPGDVANPNWLHPGRPSAGQQAFGEKLLAAHAFIVIPSAVSTQSWNLIFVAANAVGKYRMRGQQRFALDTRLHPPRRRA